MMKLTIMEPSYTDRRHFFLLENENRDFSKVEDALIDSGYERQKKSENRYSNSNVNVELSYPDSESEEIHITGVFSPSEKFAKKFRRVDRIAKGFAYAFIASFLVYILEWIVAFLLMNSVYSFVITYLDILVPITFTLFLLFGVILAISFFYLDKTSSNLNHDLMQSSMNVFVEKMDSAFPQMKKNGIAIATQYGLRSIKGQLPEEMVQKLQEGVSGDIDQRFWEGCNG